MFIYNAHDLILKMLYTVKEKFGGSILRRNLYERTNFVNKLRKSIGWAIHGERSAAERA
jgi:hypothetical protein